MEHSLCFIIQKKPIKLFQTERQPTPNFRTMRIRWNHKVDNFCYFWSKLGYSSNASSVGHIIRCCDNWKPVVQVLTYSMCEVVLIYRHVLIQEWQLFLQEHKIFSAPVLVGLRDDYMISPQRLLYAFYNAQWPTEHPQLPNKCQNIKVSQIRTNTLWQKIIWTTVIQRWCEQMRCPSQWRQ